jgi:hypothetical protein
MKKLIEIDTHACVTEKGKFQCLLCSEETSYQTLFDTEIGVMAHMLYGHLIIPDNAIIAGWTQEMADNLKEQRKRNGWNLDEDVPFFLRECQVHEARIFREGKAEMVKLKVRDAKSKKE